MLDEIQLKAVHQDVTTCFRLLREAGIIDAKKTRLTFPPDFEPLLKRAQELHFKAIDYDTNVQLVTLRGQLEVHQNQLRSRDWQIDRLRKERDEARAKLAATQKAKKAKPEKKPKPKKKGRR